MVFLVLHWLLSKKGTKANKFEQGWCDYPASLPFPHSVSNCSNLLFSGQNLSVHKGSPQGPFPNKTANIQIPPAQLPRGSLVSPDTPQGRQCMPTYTLHLRYKNPSLQCTAAQPVFILWANKDTHNHNHQFVPKTMLGLIRKLKDDENCIFLCS